MIEMGEGGSRETLRGEGVGTKGDGGGGGVGRKEGMMDEWVEGGKGSGRGGEEVGEGRVG